MKIASIVLAIATSLTAITTANAWLGDPEPVLVQRYGPSKTVEVSTGGDIPRQKGFYVELKEAFTTNVSLIAASRNDYDLDLVETRTRYSFTKNGSVITVYVGNAGEKYNGVDFAGASAREVINSPLAWQKNTHGDNVASPTLFSPATINSLLDNNKGDSTWADAWHPVFSIPGVYLRRTADKSRLAIAYGISDSEIHRLEIRMTDQSDNTAVLAPP